MGSSAPAEVRLLERALEEAVSAHLQTMTVPCLPVPDPPGPQSARAFIEKNAVALLSNLPSPQKLDPASLTWLGHHSARSHVRASGLWDINFTDIAYDPEFLGVMQQFVDGA